MAAIQASIRGRPTKKTYSYSEQIGDIILPYHQTHYTTRSQASIYPLA